MQSKQYAKAVNQAQPAILSPRPGTVGGETQRFLGLRTPRGVDVPAGFLLPSL